MLMTNYSGSLVFVLMTLYKDLLRAVSLKMRIVDVNDTLSEYNVFVTEVIQIISTSVFYSNLRDSN